METPNPSNPSDAIPAGTRIGGYTLSRKISEGGMGEVYEGVQRALKRRVAVKLLATWATGRADLRARFLREGETAARIRHHNIVEIYDVGVWGRRPYIVMEYLDGRTLEELMQLEGALPEDRVVDLMLPVMSAIGAANDRGIIHRDVKPENVFLADMDAGVEPKVLDFGISRVVTSHERLGDSQNVGTPHYMSPEQARGEPVDARSDQHSIAVVLYEMVTGHLPRDHETVSTLMRMVAHEGFVHPHEHLASLSGSFVDVLMKALSPNRDDRFDDLQDMMQALVPLASDRSRNYWEQALAILDDPNHVMERAPLSGSHRSVVGGPAHGSSASFKALEGEETHSEIAIPLDGFDAPNLANPGPHIVEPPGIDPVAPEPEKKKTPWIIILSAAVVLLVLGGWFATRVEPVLGAADVVQTHIAAPPTQPEVPEPPAPEVAVEDPQEVLTGEPTLVGENASGENASGENASGENAVEVESAPPETAGMETTEEPPARPLAAIARAERRAARAALRVLAETPTPEPPPEPSMAAVMTAPSWEPTGSSDNVDPWN